MSARSSEWGPACVRAEQMRSCSKSSVCHQLTPPPRACVLAGWARAAPSLSRCCCWHWGWGVGHAPHACMGPTCCTTARRPPADGARPSGAGAALPAARRGRAGVWGGDPRGGHRGRGARAHRGPPAQNRRYSQPDAHHHARRVCILSQPHHRGHSWLYPQGGWVGPSPGLSRRAVQWAERAATHPLVHPPPPPPPQARKGEAESTPDDIQAMVRAQLAPANRLILFLQQSSVEWASSLWMSMIQARGVHARAHAARRGRRPPTPSARRRRRRPSLAALRCAGGRPHLQSHHHGGLQV